MHKVLIILALVLTTAPAAAQAVQRDRLGTRFDNDIRANNEAMSRRFSGPNTQVDEQNTRMRERLNATRDGSRLRRLP
jgi:hypothetical protein